ncbi:RAF proto-oncogene serine/threonine-protein kinase-like [Macrobrachium nipponense]|uniref:RAF proto-oncogene serine/threonine-protein kinase-like n=1 Tax=Macrobrachium nipponense TaxID=159736 RepID=UPI0030C7BE2F
MSALRRMNVPVVNLAGVPLSSNKIGSGMFGMCYRYHFGDVEKPLVIKLFENNCSTPKVLRGILKEVTNLRSVRSIEGVPKVFAVSAVPPYGIVMSDAGTITFRDWQLQTARTPMEIISVVKKIAEIIANMHRQGIVHNDLHGKNIVINEETQKPTIVDFGLAGRLGAYRYRDYMKETPKFDKDKLKGSNQTVCSTKRTASASEKRFDQNTYILLDFIFR